MYTWYRAGSRNERPGITGIAHYFEHMMFNGTKTRAAGEFDRLMEAAGGANNAYTSPDVTVYQNWFPVTALPLVFDLEADRMRHLDFDPKVVESERGVVYSERRLRVDDDSFGQPPWMTRYLQSYRSTISAGTSEIQRNIIAQRVLGLPRG